jgi:hypothetical protein
VVGEPRPAPLSSPLQLLPCIATPPSVDAEVVAPHVCDMPPIDMDMRLAWLGVAAIERWWPGP